MRNHRTPLRIREGGRRFLDSSGRRPAASAGGVERVGSGRPGPGSDPRHLHGDGAARGAVRPSDSEVRPRAVRQTPRASVPAKAQGAPGSPPSALIRRPWARRSAPVASIRSSGRFASGLGAGRSERDPRRPRRAGDPAAIAGDRDQIYRCICACDIDIQHINRDQIHMHICISDMDLSHIDRDQIYRCICTCDIDLQCIDRDQIHMHICISDMDLSRVDRDQIYM